MTTPVLLKNLFLYGPAVISGALLVFCFPTFDLYLIAWAALVPFFVSLHDKTPKEAFKAGFLLGVPYFFGTLYWIYHSINHYGGISLPGSIALVVLLCFYLSIYPAVFGFLFTITIRNTKLPALFIAPVFWTVLEFLRSYLFTGFPWSSIGYSQYKFLTVIQIADVTGIYGVSFLVIAVNGSLADMFIMKKRTKNMPLFPLSHTLIGAAVLTVMLVITVIYGQVRLREERPGIPVTASIVQGNIEQDKKWDTAYRHAVMEAYKDLSLKAVSVNPSMIIWPETAVPFMFNEDKYYTEELTDFQNQLGRYLLFGSVLIKGKSGDRYQLSNSAVLLDDTGKVTYMYDKIHLVPFGEYVPLQKLLFFINKLVAGIGDYTGGERYVRAVTPFGDFATLICYEIIFPGLVRKFYANGGDFMVTITNDAWFGKTTGPYQHFSIAVLRAVENRKPLIRAANTGISGFIDSSGRIVASTELFERVLLTQQLRTDYTRSFYSKYGDLFTYLCIIISVVLAANLFGKARIT